MFRCFQKIPEAISRHYSNTQYHRSEAQLEREKWWIKNIIPFHRSLLLPAAVLIQICCGSLYAWSGYNLPMEAYILGLNGAVDRAQASITFYIAVAFFGFTAAILGPWLERNGPFKGAILGASLFFIGNLLTALGVYVKNFGLIYFAYGVIGGAGLGISYISPVSPLQKWFPEIRGLAGGMAVCGFGAGSIFSPYTQKALIGSTYANNGVEAVGLPLTFVILGSCYFFVMVLSATVLRMPPPGYVKQGVSIDTIKGAENDQILDSNNRSVFAMTLTESLSSREYILTYFMFLCNELAGLLIISKIQSIVQNQLRQSADYAVMINSALGGMNLGGRLTVPLLSDYIGHRKPFFLISLVCQAIFLGLLPHAINNQNIDLVLAAAFIIAFFYGSGFGIIPSFLADQFGAKNVGATHGMILTAWAIAGVAGGLIFTDVYNRQKATLIAEMGTKQGLLYVYNIDFQWILAFVCFGFILAILIPTNLRDRKLPFLRGEMCRVRFCNRMLRCVWLPKSEEDIEWNSYKDSLRQKVNSQKQIKLGSEAEILQNDLGTQKEMGTQNELLRVEKQAIINEKL